MYRKKWVAYILISPMVLFIVAFLFYPFIVNVISSFFSYQSMLDESPKFVKLDNYITMFTDEIFQRSLLNTFILIALVIIFQVGLALILSLLVNSIKKFSSFYKIVFFMPIVISATAIGLMFNLFYEYNYGMFNQLLLAFGYEKIFWKDPENLIRLFTLMVTPVIWQYVGFYFVIFLTGLSGINSEILEAAEIDGCNGFQKVRYISIPMIKNVTRVVFVLAITGTLKVFDLPFIISPGGYPSGKLHFLGTYMYAKAFNSNDIGFAAAFAVFIVIAGVLLSLVSNSILKHDNDL